MAKEDSNKRQSENQDYSRIDSHQRKNLEGYLEELEKARGKLKTGEIGVEEAKQSLRDNSEISAKIMVEQEAEETSQITEAEKRAGKEVEKAAQKQAKLEEKEARQAREAEKRAVKEAEKAAQKQAEMEEKEARQARETEERTGKEAEKAAQKQAKLEEKEARQAREAKETTKTEVKEEVEEIIEAEVKEEIKQVQGMEDDELIEGELDLILVSPVDSGRRREFKKQLYQVQDLRVVLLSGSVDKGTTIMVSAEKPIPLINILRAMPPVNQVTKDGNQIQVKLKENDGPPGTL